MKVQEIYDEFKKVAKDINGEVMAMQADGLACDGYAVIKNNFNSYSVYVYDKCLRPITTYPIRTFTHLKEAMAVFHMLRYNALPYVEYPF